MDFWEVHGIVFLICAAFFPRFTMLYAMIYCSLTPFGVLGWLGWVFMPHLTVAVIATTAYWDTNPILCVIAWIVALCGTGCEGRVVNQTTKRNN